MNIAGIFAALESHALATGQFRQFNRHEPKSKPMAAISGHMTIGPGGPAPRASGLAATSIRQEFNIRLTRSMTAEPQDSIDGEILTALDALLSAYNADFDLGGLIMCIDLLGSAGAPMTWRAGYVTIDNTMFRCVDLLVPAIIDSAYIQGAT